jgi:hypothetical protein
MVPHKVSRGAVYTIATNDNITLLYITVGKVYLDALVRVLDVRDLASKADVRLVGQVVVQQLEEVAPLEQKHVASVVVVQVTEKVVVHNLLAVGVPDLPAVHGDARVSGGLEASNLVQNAASVRPHGNTGSLGRRDLVSSLQDNMVNVGLLQGVRGDKACHTSANNNGAKAVVLGSHGSFLVCSFLRVCGGCRRYLFFFFLFLNKLKGDAPWKNEASIRFSIRDVWRGCVGRFDG